MTLALAHDWVCIELPGYRHNRPYHTYGRWSWDQLPPINRVITRDLGWLLQEPVAGDWSIASAEPEDHTRVRRWLSELGPDFVVPQAFESFVASPAAPSRIRSATGCYLDFAQRIVPSPDDGVLIHFLSDQQWSLHWWLYLGRDGSEGVVAAYPPYGFDLDSEDASELDDYGVENLDIFSPAATGAALCSSSFLDFVYRYWIENEIFFRLRDGGLTEEQRRYLDYYREHPSKAEPR